jgi:hypothetical protein
VRYVLAAVLAVVMALPPANVGAGPVLPPDAFLIVGASADLSEIDFIFCGNLVEPNVWALVTFEAAAVGVAYVGSDAKVSAKGVRMKQNAKSANGDIRLFTDFPTSPRTRGPSATETNVKASMTASFNPKTLELDAKVVDKTNGTTVELASAEQIYLISNFTALIPCQDLIDSIEASRPIPQSVRGLLR